MAPVLHDLLPGWSSPLGLAYAFVACIAIIIVCERFFLGVPYPKGIPLIREPEGARRFSLRTRLAYYTDCEALFREAYQNVTNVPRYLSVCSYS
jgi:hypothetical protein